jgi:hypothetical protein
MIKRIILDVDDVLNSLTMFILQNKGCDVGHWDYERFPTEVGYDIISACEKLGGRVPYLKNPILNGTPEYLPDVASFWDGVTAMNLWRTAPKSPQCDMLIERAADIVGKTEVYLATTPTKDPQSHADKVHWIQDNLPSWIHRQYAITPRKWIIGKPGVALFDDSQENCQNFTCDLNGGGISFLVPRPWNPSHALDTSKTLEEYFESLAQGVHDNA